MIEVEKKFVLTFEEQKRLLADARLESEQSIADTYYDTSEYALLKSDRILRIRDGQPNLKIALAKRDAHFVARYHEVEDERRIRILLGLQSSGAFAQALIAAGFQSFYSVITRRKTFRDAGFRIDVDRADYADGTTYELCEIELLVESVEQSEEAAKKIAEHAKGKNIPLAPARGKLLNYLFKTKPDVYAMICERFGFFA